MESWVNEFSVMLVHASYNDALYDAQALQDALEDQLKYLGYMYSTHHIKFNMECFIPGDDSQVGVFDKALAPLDWEITICVPTFEMKKEAALKIGEITRCRIEAMSRRKRFGFFAVRSSGKVIHSQLGYVKFDGCHEMSEDEAEKFEEINI